MHRIWHHEKISDFERSQTTCRRFAFSILIAPLVLNIAAPAYLALPALAEDDGKPAASKADTRLLKFTPDPISIDPDGPQSTESLKDTSAEPTKDPSRESAKETTKASSKDSETDAPGDSDARSGRRISSDTDSRRRSIAQNTPSSGSSNSKDSPSTSLSDFSANPEEAARQLAQSLARKPSVTSISGTVQVRRPFKLFASQELLHNMSFRDMPAREVIAELARRGNLNIIIDKSVVGKITGDLKDLTLDEAMDTVLAAAGLQSRKVDSTVIVGTPQAMVQLGLNRPVARVFKLSYAHPYDVAMLLNASVFNRGYIPKFSQELKRSGDLAPDPGFAEGGGREESNNNQITELDTEKRQVLGTSRSQTQEGVGFNNAAVDPGTQQIRTFQEVPATYVVDPNGGSTIVVPDVKNRQILVVGTSEDLNVAEEAIRILDRRPRQVHVQTSLVELTNQGIRQLSANVSTQGNGLSAAILGNSAAPLVRYLPGLGGQSNNVAGTGTQVVNQVTSPINIPFTTSPSQTQITQTSNSIAQASNSVTNFSPANPFTGLVGSVLPTTVQQIAGVSSVPAAQTGINLLTLGGGAGGRANIATMPTALNISLNMLLQTNKAKLIANPSVVVVDNTESLITLAQEVVHKVTSTVSLGVVTTNVELTKAGIFLNVLPKVAEDGFITMRLRPQVSTPLGAPLVFGNPNQNPTIVTLLNIRDIMSQEVRVKDGQTLVIGGLFTENEAAILAKVPYLAETPVLGALFRNSLKGRNRTELMLLITPKIVEEDPNPTQITDKPSPLM
ncbi:MAG TPA: hypothetical protein EYN91_03750 [Candidatus Melainabacteria bacterium]|nr:hypothetical protein [Candidatus Melainabacteria bacterium]HIN64749.1 hypothetical protein [Candidatus Obscuribacterales bacterium]